MRATESMLRQSVSFPSWEPGWWCPVDNAVFQFMDKKRFEGKHFYVYMTAAANKFLRIYYARVTEHLNSLQVA